VTNGQTYGYLPSNTISPASLPYGQNIKQTTTITHTTAIMVYDHFPG